MKEITFDELLELFVPETHGRLRQLADEDNTTHIVVFRNQNFDSFQYGTVTAMVVGPNHTYETPEDVEGKHLFDLPSQRQQPAYVWRKLKP